MSNAVVTDWPSGSANTGWPQEPSAMLMPGRVQGWPAGTQRAANAAERLLSQATAWWDVEQYRDGDRFLRNRGTGGELLDLRLGSDAVANSNDPRFLAPEDQGYVYLPGSGTNSISVAHAANQNTTDLDVRVKVALDDWTPASTAELASKRGGGGNRGWVFRVLTSGVLQLTWSADGTAEVSANSTAAPSVSDGAALWVRATLDVDNGASGYDAKFWTSSDGVTWSQLGSTVTGGSTTSIYASTAGFFDQGSGNFKPGKVYRLQLMDSIDGTAVVDIDCDAITSGSATSFTAVTNQTVTINRSTSGRKSVAMPSRHKGGRPVMLLGTDDYLEVQDNWQHGLLNFGQGDSFTLVGVRRHFGTATGQLIGRQIGSSATGYGLSVANSAFRLTDPAGNTDFSSGTVTAGIVATTIGVRNPVADTITSFINGVAQTVTTDPTTGTLSNTDGVRIGRQSGTSGSNYAAMEFYAAAIFRRALSPAEITTLSNYFTGRIA